MKEDQRTFLAVALCTLAFLAYQQYLAKRYPQPEPTPTSIQQSPSEADKSPTNKVETSEISRQPIVKPVVPEQRLTSFSMKNPKMSVEWGTRGNIDSVKLHAFEEFELVDLPIEVRPLVNGVDIEPSELQRSSPTNASFIAANPEWQVRQSFTIDPEKYLLHSEVSATNQSQSPLDLKLGVHVADGVPVAQSSMFSFFSSAVIYNLVASQSGSLSNLVTLSSCSVGEIKNVSDASLDFIGIEKRYFLRLIHPSSGNIDYKASLQPGKDCRVNYSLDQKQGIIAPGGQAVISFDIFLGPREENALEAAGPQFDSAINLGFFSVVARPLLWIIKLLYRFLGNYGLAIILLTVLIKMLFYPLTVSSVKSMRKMQKLAPEMARIREKYKSDQQKQNEEIMRFMATHKINPVLGCLPLLPQIPVFFALYTMLSQSIEMRGAPFFLWIQDLSFPDPYFATPLALGALTYVQQKLTPNPQMDEMQQKIFLMLPLIITATMLSLPAGLVLYMLTNTVLSIAQQQWLNYQLKEKE